MGGTTKVLPKLRTCCLKYFGNQPLKPRGMHEAKTQRSSLFECSLYNKSINIRVGWYADSGQRASWQSWGHKYHRRKFHSKDNSFSYNNRTGLQTLNFHYCYFYTFSYIFVHTENNNNGSLEFGALCDCCTASTCQKSTLSVKSKEITIHRRLLPGR